MYRIYKTDKDIPAVAKDGTVKYRSDFILDSENDVEQFKKETAEYPAGTTGLICTTGEILIMNCQGEYKPLLS